MLLEAPEDVLEHHDPPLEVERVEADLHGGDTVVWARIAGSAADTGTEERRVYVLSPGRLQTLNLGLADGLTTICNTHFANWHIVGQDALS